MSAATKMDEPAEMHSIERKLSGYDWKEIAQELDRDGQSVLLNLFSLDECNKISNMYDEEQHFRSRIYMAKYGFGKGEYRYFRYPLPNLIGQHRQAIYPYLAKMANDWNQRLGIDKVYPPELKALLEECWDGGQTKPTPLLLKYDPGDYNCLHQDLYGDLVFPIQVAVLLSAPGEDFTGGEFVIVEQRPRMQSRADVIHLQKGDAVIFAVHSRPVNGSKSTYRVNLKHGVSRIKTGRRYTLGIIFHDAT